MFLRNWARLYSKMTPAERRAEELICLLGKRYRAQHPFFGMRRIVDFALPDDKVIIEVDGSSHDLPVQRRKDIVSTLTLEEQGWRTVRFTNAEVLALGEIDRDWFWEKITEKLIHRPTPAELQSALQDLDREFPELSAKTRKRRRAPGPKKARKSARRSGSKSASTQ